jgi:LPS-assembly lipoprotein
MAAFVPFGPRSRVVSRRAALMGMAALLGGCGFELRKPAELHFRGIQLVGFHAHSPFAQELTKQINASPATQVVESAAQAQVVLESITDARERIVAASTATGLVTEFTLRSRFKFRLRTPAGKVLIPDTELLLSRDLSYSESIALAKEQEEEFLFRALQSDIVDQVMRRLSAVRTF